MDGPVGSGVAQWRGETGSSGHHRRLSSDGSVREYVQYDAVGKKSDVMRASPSPLASRPQPRLGLVSTLYTVYDSSFSRGSLHIYGQICVFIIYMFIICLNLYSHGQ